MKTIIDDYCKDIETIYLSKEREIIHAIKQ